MKFHVGQTVAYGDPNGSWGVIESPRNYDDGFYVRWNHGKDVNGNYIQDLGSYSKNELMPLDRGIYKRYINCRAWSPEQKPIRKEAGFK